MHGDDMRVLEGFLCFNLLVVLLEKVFIFAYFGVDNFNCNSFFELWIMRTIYYSRSSLANDLIKLIISYSIV
jgi:hypothetical protein